MNWDAIRSITTAKSKPYMAAYQYSITNNLPWPPLETTITA
jgi:hypothetical protein